MSNVFKNLKQEKGVSLIITFFVMAIILSIVLSISALLYSQIKVMRNIGNSVASLYAADSGIEKILYYDRQVWPNDGNTCTLDKDCLSAPYTYCDDGLCTIPSSRGLCSIFDYCTSSGSEDPSVYCGATTDGPNPPVAEGNDCAIDSCADCTVRFDTAFDKRTYSVVAKVYPNGEESDFTIESKGNYNNASRQIKILIATAIEGGVVTVPIFTLTPATGITESTATLNGEITGTGRENPDVTVYWGPTDGHQTPGNWANSFILGSQGLGSFYKNLEGLAPNKTYYFSASAANSAGTVWAESSLSFTTAINIILPTVVLTSPTNITSSGATINGTITDTGNEDPIVDIYWGLSDGRHSPGDWENTATLGQQGVAAFSKDISGLASGTTYYFSASATNSAGMGWPLASSSFVADGWLAGWSGRQKITIKHTNVDENLSNFPLLVKFTNNADLSDALANGYDIRFTQSDGTTLLKYERESWSGGGGASASGIFWVKIPTISHTSDTDIYVYYGKSGATDGQDKTNVWDLNYKGIWHLGDVGPITAVDSTGTYNATQSGSLSFGAIGKLDGATNFDGSNDYLSMSPIAGIQGGDFTVGAWIKQTAGSVGADPDVVFDQSDSAGNHETAWLDLELSCKARIATYEGGYGTVVGTTNLCDNNWHYVVGVKLGTAGYIYVDGARQNSGTLRNVLATTRANIGTIDGGYGYFFHGFIDETRIASTARNAAWIKFEYNNMNSADNELIIEGNLKSIIVLNSTTSITTTTATLNGAITDIGKDNPVVKIYWGTTDGHKTPGNWENTATLGQQGVAAFSKDISGLASGTTYYFSASATNSAGTAWPATSSSFVTNGWLSGWTERKKISIKHTNVDEDLLSFPLLVKLSNNADLSSALSTGYDIRFTQSNGTTLLKYERESWSGGGGAMASGIFWVKVPTISRTVDTDIYVYYGKADATDGQDKTNVWDSSFKGVWHLKETGTNPTVYDSTSNANNSTTQTWIPTTSGKVGSAGSFNGTSQCISFGTAKIPTSGDFTVQGLIYTNNVINEKVWMSQYDSPYPAGRLILEHRADAPGKSSFFEGGGTGVVTGTGLIASGTWYSIDLVRSGNTWQLYRNGVVDGSGASSSQNPQNVATRIGCANGTFLDYWNGFLDEVRISSVARNAAWIKFGYNNMNSADNELSWGQ